MGKRGKKHREPQGRRGGDASDDDDILPSSAYDVPPPTNDREHQQSESGEEEDEGNDDGGRAWAAAAPSKFHLYQLSVQSPKGDISYMQKFFLMYVGGRSPLHLQEDFCGTALLSCEWLRSDPRRTAIGVDLDLEALNWCLENNLNKVGGDGCSRFSLLHGNVLRPQEACLVKHQVEDLVKDVALCDKNGASEAVTTNERDDSEVQGCFTYASMKFDALPNRDIVCAFNYSCCCLQKRKDLVLYFKHAFNALSKKGGIFVMDLYGGVSSECKLRLRRRFSNFTYVWEQAEFDIINRRTKISLHFHLGKRRIIRHAFSYDWRLWSLPEIKDCLEEAGFGSIHVWIRKMPDTTDNQNSEEFTVSRDVKYEKVASFQQQDAWNAYIVSVANV
ncbi:hypothetical protein OPV22_009761 [Ensete ventricosum]|uniref:Methyltransferase type 11 domain-containing protein n=1 Tax=Ensete ventricosum TaxID=4639 RepID=A0AAV8PTK4_ENSVE|nr:hypothetical protein OPV22_009761 [Ensete ventricosum]